jgi:hypothetical protein
MVRILTQVSVKDKLQPIRRLADRVTSIPVYLPESDQYDFLISGMVAQVTETSKKQLFVKIIKPNISGQKGAAKENTIYQIRQENFSDVELIR